MTEEKRQYQKSYYEQNKERLLALQRERNKKNYQAKKDAYNLKSKKWAEENPERMRELQKDHQKKPKWKKYRKDYYQRNKEKNKKQTRDNKLKRCYGITLDDYNKMLLKQEGKCCICGRTQKEAAPGRKGNLVVDHCHETGKVRGLLCHHCNAALGQFQDDVKVMRRAIKYLKNSKNLD